MKKPKTNFFELFRGEYCEMILGLEVTTSITLDDSGSPQQVRMPLTVTGFVMDVDDQFLYLSPDGININQAFPMNELKHIQIVDVQDEVDQALDEASPPEDDRGYN